MIFCDNEDFHRFFSIQLNTYPKFRECIENHIFSYIHGNRQPFQQNILSLIRMESAYMNTNHAELKMDQ